MQMKIFPSSNVIKSQIKNWLLIKTSWKRKNQRLKTNSNLKNITEANQTQGECQKLIKIWLGFKLKIL